MKTNKPHFILTIQGYYNWKQNNLEGLKELTKEYNIYITYNNTIYTVDEDGDLIGVYKE